MGKKQKKKLCDICTISSGKKIYHSVDENGNWARDTKTGIGTVCENG